MFNLMILILTSISDSLLPAFLDVSQQATATVVVEEDTDSWTAATERKFAELCRCPVRTFHSSWGSKGS